MADRGTSSGSGGGEATQAGKKSAAKKGSIDFESFINAFAVTTSKKPQKTTPALGRVEPASLPFSFPQDDVVVSPVPAFTWEDPPVQQALAEAEEPVLEDEPAPPISRLQSTSLWVEDQPSLRETYVPEPEVDFEQFTPPPAYEPEFFDAAPEEVKLPPAPPDDYGISWEYTAPAEPAPPEEPAPPIPEPRSRAIPPPPPQLPGLMDDFATDLPGVDFTSLAPPPAPPPEAPPAPSEEHLAAALAGHQPEVPEPEAILYAREKATSLTSVGPSLALPAVVGEFSLAALFKEMIARRASDLHFTVGSVPLVRISGDLYRTDFPPITSDLAQELLFPLLTPQQRYIFEETGDLDFALEIQQVARFRVNFFMQNRGMGAAFRLVPNQIPSLEDLGLPRAVRRITRLKKGLVIVTGPTGSGKTTTLAALINEINLNRQAHIITVEDPLEFVHTSQKCLITHREVGTHAATFVEALRAAIREDPDIIMVGEMRDLDTINLALRAAETGVLVMGTLHTNSAAKTVDRVIDVFPNDQQEQIRSMLSDSLRAVLSQHLLKTKDGRGRVVAMEILMATPGLSNIIREGKTYQIESLIQTGKEYGMQNMDHALIRLIKAGLIEREHVRDRVSDFRTFERAGITFAPQVPH